MKRRNRRSNKVVETQSLERRSLLTALAFQNGGAFQLTAANQNGGTPDPMGDLQYVDSSPAIFASNLDTSVAGGILTINGTDNRDQITVSEYSVDPHGWGRAAAYLRITVRGANNQLIGMESFRKSIVERIQVNAGSGNDTVRNNTDLPSVLRGDHGNDVLEGGSAADIIHGGFGSDEIYGKLGHDVLYGNLGNDTIFGGPDNDVIYGGSNNDTISGGSGNDVIRGENGIDHIWGNDGDDVIDGGFHTDWIYGGNHNDRISGNGGNDFLFGQSGEDVAFGGDGNDWIDGGANADGLFGGTGIDTLTGGSGGDRFLVWHDQGGVWQSSHNDTLRDVRSEDARVKFVDSDQATVSTVYTSRAWLSSEIETLDLSLSMLMQRTGNTELLKKANGGIVEVKRFGAQRRNAGSAWASNNGQRIAMLDGAFSEDALFANYVFLHEIGHYWDEASENSRISDFRAISGWRETRGGRAGTGETESLNDNDKWVYQSTATFVSDYATSHPYEDWAESFATNLMVNAGVSISGAWASFNNTTAQTVADSGDKMDLLDDFFADF